MRTGTEVWEEVASSWEHERGAVAVRAYSDAVNGALLERWLPTRIGTVLKTDLFDEATADGLVGLLLARAERVVGIDVAPSIVKAAGVRNPGLEAAVADVQELPFDDGSIDVVVSNSTLDHFASLAEIDRALLELARVLRPGGLLIVTLDNDANPVIWLRNRIPRSLLHRSGLVPYPVGRTLSPSGLRDAVERAGFAVDRTAVIAHVPRLAVRLFGLRSPRLLAAERAGMAPTRALTGQFAAVRARAQRGTTAVHPRPAARRSQVPPLVERALAATVLRRLALFSLDLGSPRPPREEAGIPLELGFLEPAEAEAHHAARAGSGEAARERLRRGACCFAARTADGRIASVRWIARGDAHIDFLDCTLPLTAVEAYNFDTWTDPAFRGLGVASASGARLNELLAADGVRTVIRAVWPANDQGLRNAAREGFVPAGTIVSVRLGPLRRRIVRRAR
jgi:SAM-dependent methyltransferase/GNAT superfamily N-acetyltransferase